MGGSPSRNHLLLRIATAMFLFVCNVAHGQNETGKRPINRSRFESMGYWYTPSNAMYQVRYPIIRSLPPLNSGMPWDILAAYVYMDSLARFDGGLSSGKVM